ncbi:MAG: LysM peptidoglycan-binding domain-containing protein [Anaerolineae bacterium]|nr:LysM peptidoglycan-binding domain-containing protein [Anaerolineae bacterium]
MVSHGETLYRIAQHYNTTMQAIIDANNISNPDAIYAGQALNIPCGTPTDTVTVSNPPASNTGNSGGSGANDGTTTTAQPGDSTGTIPCGDLTTAVAGSFNGIAENFSDSGLPMPSIGGGLPCQ